VDGGSSKTTWRWRIGPEARAFVAGPGTNHEWRGMVPIRKIFRAMLGRACRAARCMPRDIKAGCWGLCVATFPRTLFHLERTPSDR